MIFDALIVLLADEGLVELLFGPFEDSATHDAR
jgi:hypothetical protein